MNFAEGDYFLRFYILIEVESIHMSAYLHIAFALIHCVALTLLSKFSDENSKTNPIIIVDKYNSTNKRHGNARLRATK